MKQIQPDEIGYYGRPVTDLTREELLRLVSELCSVLKECHCNTAHHTEPPAVETHRQLH